jgi:hypothetical protein
MMATGVTVNRSTISEMISHATGQQEHRSRAPQPAQAGRDSGPALLQPCLVCLSMLIPLPA